MSIPGFASVKHGHAISGFGSLQMPISKIKAPLRDPNGYSANVAHDSARQENSQTRRAPGGLGDLSMQLDDFRYKKCRGALRHAGFI